MELRKLIRKFLTAQFYTINFRIYGIKERYDIVNFCGSNMLFRDETRDLLALCLLMSHDPEGSYSLIAV